MPVELVELYLEDWVTPTEHPPTGHAEGVRENDETRWSWLATTALGRQKRARIQWAAEHGLTWWELLECYPRAWLAPRSRSRLPGARRSGARSGAEVAAAAIDVQPAGSVAGADLSGRGSAAQRVHAYRKGGG